MDVKILYFYINKNDNIHSNEVQQIRWSDKYSQYTLAANITEYHIISKSAKVIPEKSRLWKPD